VDTRPRRFTAHELKKVGVTLAETGLPLLRCDHCGKEWMPAYSAFSAVQDGDVVRAIGGVRTAAIVRQHDSGSSYVLLPILSRLPEEFLAPFKFQLTVC
jgi:hypothetical protein